MNDSYYLPVIFLVSHYRGILIHLIGIKIGFSGKSVAKFNAYTVKKVFIGTIYGNHARRLKGLFIPAESTAVHVIFAKTRQGSI